MRVLSARRVLLLLATCLAASIVYLLVAYVRLETAFKKRNQRAALTRVFSDVTRIAPGQTRALVMGRLEALRHQIAQEGAAVSFTLHAGDYPDGLIPHAQALQDAPVTLTFSGTLPDAVLETIEARQAQLPEIFLEPEQIALFAGGAREIRDDLRLEDVPEVAWRAVITLEDQAFFSHRGVALRALARALWVNLKTFSFAQGGSTLTQQLVKNITGRRGKNPLRKIAEVLFALVLERRFDKAQILERYLNEVYFGGSGGLPVHGFASGARYLFGKELAQLNTAEMAMMVGLIRAPNYDSPFRNWQRAERRTHLVLDRLVQTGLLKAAEAREAKATPIRLARFLPVASKAPHFTDLVRAELARRLRKLGPAPDAGLNVYTTLDVAMNQKAREALVDGAAQVERTFETEKAFRLDAVLIAVDHATGFIRALIGGREYNRPGANSVARMRRQAGSAFKPVLYLAAFSRADVNGIPYGPGYPVEDAPWRVSYREEGQRKIWAPRNVTRAHKGWIPLRFALAESINVVAAKLGMEIGLEAIIQTAARLGIRSEMRAVPSLTLGTVEVSPLELAGVYTTLANHGMRNELVTIRGITFEDGRELARFSPAPVRASDPARADLVTHVLEDVFRYGTAAGARTMGWDRPGAGKTGSTNDSHDSWFAGFTPQLTALVWVGLEPKPGEVAEAKLTGALAALPIWVGFMREALAGVPPTPFPANEQLVDVAIDIHSGRAAARGCPRMQVSVEKYVVDGAPAGESCAPLPPPSSALKKT